LSIEEEKGYFELIFDFDFILDFVRLVGNSRDTELDSGERMLETYQKKLLKNVK